MRVLCWSQAAYRAGCSNPRYCSRRVAVIDSARCPSFDVLGCTVLLRVSFVSLQKCQNTLCMNSFTTVGHTPSSNHAFAVEIRSADRFDERVLWLYTSGDFLSLLRRSLGLENSSL